MEIRRAAVSDFMPIAALDRTAWSRNRNAEFIPDGEHVWRLWVAHGLVYCAMREGEIVGAIVAFPCLPGAAQDGENLSGDRKSLFRVHNSLFCVHKAFVVEALRGQQVGTRLFEALLAELDRLGAESFLTVDPINEAGIRLYEKWGYTERRFVKGYYRPHEDRYVLTRPARLAGR
jgi:ribosomal protein S18 acetylase RimI-like enzyme